WWGGGGGGGGDGPEGDVSARGGIARARGADGMHAATDGEDRSLRPAAGGDHAGKAALLRDRDGAFGLRNRSSGRKPHGAAHEDRGESPPSGEPRGDRRVLPGIH